MYFYFTIYEHLFYGYKEKNIDERVVVLETKVEILLQERSKMSSNKEK
jgi:hypothetical protein